MENEAPHQEGNVEILREAYRQWSDSKGGSVDHWIGLLDPNVSVMSLANGAGGLDYTRQCIGCAGVRDYLDSVLRDWDMVSYRMEEFVAEGDRVVAIGHFSWRNKNTGKTFQSPKVDIWRLSDGKIIEFFELYDTAKLLAAASPL